MTELPVSVESDGEADESSRPTVAAEGRLSDASISTPDAAVTSAEDVEAPSKEAPSEDAGDDGFLDDLALPSLVSAPEPLAAGTEIGPDGRLRVTDRVGAR